MQLKLQVELIPVGGSDVTTNNAIARKFLHLTSPSSTLSEVCDALLKRYYRLYPGAETLDLDGVQDKDGCDLDPEFTAGDVFVSGDALRVLVRNSFQALSRDTSAVLPAGLLDISSASVKRGLSVDSESDTTRFSKRSRTIWAARSANSEASDSIANKTQTSIINTTILPKEGTQDKLASSENNVASSPVHLPPPSDNNTLESSKIIPVKRLSPQSARGKRITSGMLVIPSNTEVSEPGNIFSDNDDTELDNAQDSYAWLARPLDKQIVDISDQHQVSNGTTAGQQTSTNASARAAEIVRSPFSSNNMKPSISNLVQNKVKSSQPFLQSSPKETTLMQELPQAKTHPSKIQPHSSEAQSSKIHGDSSGKPPPSSVNPEINSDITQYKRPANLSVAHLLAEQQGSAGGNGIVISKASSQESPNVKSQGPTHVVTQNGHPDKDESVRQNPTNLAAGNAVSQTTNSRQVADSHRSHIGNKPSARAGNMFLSSVEASRSVGHNSVPHSRVVEAPYQSIDGRAEGYRVPQVQDVEVMVKTPAKAQNNDIRPMHTKTQNSLRQELEGQSKNSHSVNKQTSAQTEASSAISLPPPKVVAGITPSKAAYAASDSFSTSTPQHMKTFAHTSTTISSTQEWPRQSQLYHPQTSTVATASNVVGAPKIVSHEAASKSSVAHNPLILHSSQPHVLPDTQSTPAAAPNQPITTSSAENSKPATLTKTNAGGSVVDTGGKSISGRAVDTADSADVKKGSALSSTEKFHEQDVSVRTPPGGSTATMAKQSLAKETFEIPKSVHSSSQQFSASSSNSQLPNEAGVANIKNSNERPSLNTKAADVVIPPRANRASASSSSPKSKSGENQSPGPTLPKDVVLAKFKSSGSLNLSKEVNARSTAPSKESRLDAEEEQKFATNLAFQEKLRSRQNAAKAGAGLMADRLLRSRVSINRVPDLATERANAALALVENDKESRSKELPSPFKEFTSKVKLSSDFIKLTKLDSKIDKMKAERVAMSKAVKLEEVLSRPTTPKKPAETHSGTSTVHTSASPSSLNDEDENGTEDSSSEEEDSEEEGSTFEDAVSSSEEQGSGTEQQDSAIKDNNSALKENEPVTKLSESGSQQHSSSSEEDSSSGTIESLAKSVREPDTRVPAENTNLIDATNNQSMGVEISSREVANSASAINAFDSSDANNHADERESNSDLGKTEPSVNSAISVADEGDDSSSASSSSESELEDSSESNQVISVKTTPGIRPAGRPSSRAVQRKRAQKQAEGADVIILDSSSESSEEDSSDEEEVSITPTAKSFGVPNRDVSVNTPSEKIVQLPQSARKSNPAETTTPSPSIRPDQFGSHDSSSMTASTGDLAKATGRKGSTAGSPKVSANTSTAINSTPKISNSRQSTAKVVANSKTSSDAVGSSKSSSLTSRSASMPTPEKLSKDESSKLGESEKSSNSTVQSIKSVKRANDSVDSTSQKKSKIEDKRTHESHSAQPSASKKHDDTSKLKNSRNTSQVTAPSSSIRTPSSINKNVNPVTSEAQVPGDLQKPDNLFSSKLPIQPSSTGSARQKPAQPGPSQNSHGANLPTKMAGTNTISSASDSSSDSDSISESSSDSENDKPTESSNNIKSQQHSATVPATRPSASLLLPKKYKSATGTLLSQASSGPKVKPDADQSIRKIVGSQPTNNRIQSTKKAAVQKPSRPQNLIQKPLLSRLADLSQRGVPEVTDKNPRGVAKPLKPSIKAVTNSDSNSESSSSSESDSDSSSSSGSSSDDDEDENDGKRASGFMTLQSKKGSQPKKKKTNGGFSSLMKDARKA